MSTATGTWLAGLIQDHLEDLAQGLADAARRDIPFYQPLPPDQVRLLFAALYRALAGTFASGDLTPLRTYMEEITAARIRSGVPATSYIALIPLSQANLCALIERAGASDPAQAAEAIRQVQMIHANARLVLSEINLRVLNQPGR